MVAQDISSADVTPVTQEFLWIGKLSLSSKGFDEWEDGSQEERANFIETPQIDATQEEKEPSLTRPFA
eukprot:6765102-Ditylum_brightwellii.AAC.1